MEFKSLGSGIIAVFLVYLSVITVQVLSITAEEDLTLTRKEYDALNEVIVF